MSDVETRIQRLYRSKTSAEVEASYDEWAGDYETDLESFGYRIPGVAAGLFGRFVPPDDAMVLDAGCGTGLMGQLLRILGYQSITGIDLSDGMLGVAADSGAYASLRKMRLGDRLDFDDDVFTATTAIGVLTPGHAGPESLEELIRVTKAGGHLIVSMRADGEVGRPYTDVADALESDGRWRALYSTPPFFSMPKGEPEVQHLVSTFQVL